MGHAYAGGGRWNYLLNAEGRVQQGTIALYTDLFVLMALCAYLQASGRQQDLPLVEATFQAAAQNLCNDQFPDLFPQQYQPGRISHGKYMIALNAFACAAPVLGWNRCKPLIAYCLDRIFGVLADPVRPTVYELRTLQGGGVDTEEGHRLNPGHIFESMWFVLALPPQMVSPDQRDLALRIVRATADQSLDRRYGGVVHMLDDEGHEGRYVDWDPNRALKWDEKVWWTHAEVLCALLIHADQTGSKASLGDFMALYTWCKRHFWDEEYGEWYAVLHRGRQAANHGQGRATKIRFPCAACTVQLLPAAAGKADFRQRRRGMTYPNILFILADDLGCWSLGYTGNQDAITPHLDGMARQGMVIQNFFCASPVCSPAVLRCSLGVCLRYMACWTGWMVAICLLRAHFQWSICGNSVAILTICTKWATSARSAESGTWVTACALKRALDTGTLISMAAAVTRMHL